MLPELLHLGPVQVNLAQEILAPGLKDLFLLVHHALHFRFILLLEQLFCMHLTGFMDKNPDVGLVMPKILYPDGSPQCLCKLLPRPSISSAAAALAEVGMFDERFFLYMEDADLCRRIGQKYRTVYYPEVHVTHAFKKASYKELKLLYQHMRSAVLYFNKWGWFRDPDRKRINRETLTRYVQSKEQRGAGER